jgi:hypothetical protein
MSMGVGSPTLDVTQDGERISGVYASRYGDYPVTGTVRGRSIAFSFTMRPGDDPATISFTGEVSADGQTMNGRAHLDEMGEATWTAERSRPVVPRAESARVLREHLLRQREPHGRA